MGLEHRWSQRLHVCLKGLIFHHLPGLHRVTLINISQDGAFITTENFRLPLHTIVELSFVLEATGKQIIQQMEAFVIHHNRNGYGMMFKDYRFPIHALRSVFHAA